MIKELNQNFEQHFALVDFLHCAILGVTWGMRQTSIWAPVNVRPFFLRFCLDGEAEFK